MKVYINDDFRGVKRKVVESEVIEDRVHSVLVTLPDGNIIARKKKRDIVL